MIQDELGAVEQHPEHVGQRVVVRGLAGRRPCALRRRPSRTATARSSSFGCRLARQRRPGTASRSRSAVSRNGASTTAASVSLFSRVVASAMTLPFISASACRIEVCASVGRSDGANVVRNSARAERLPPSRPLSRSSPPPRVAVAGRHRQAVEELLGGQAAQRHAGEQRGSSWLLCVRGAACSW